MSMRLYGPRRGPMQRARERREAARRQQEEREEQDRLSAIGEALDRGLSWNSDELRALTGAIEDHEG